ncbi:SSI family serine proteinase inhibitor [Actinoplanes sp. URMC 104]|uniref:SSI family serine proteinase inhibitor n=1 Tax=Actinoplanes sp. URMC 104 TaxID=3423409 RepID=UPI003F1BF9B8
MLPLLLATALAAPHAALIGPVPDPKPTYGSAPRPGAASAVMLSHATDAGQPMAVKLTCDPPGGGHPRAVQACTLLEQVDADPARIPRKTGACILLYKPVTASLTGTWQGRPVSWTHRFGNSCEMRRATGVLFRF